MADQVNPLGGLAVGMAQSLQSLAVPLQPKPASPPPAESKPKASEERGVGVSKESLEEAAKSVEDFLQNNPTDLNIQFLVDKDTGIRYLKIIDSRTQETIRQIPSEEILAMSKRLRALSAQDGSGVLMDAEG